MHKPLQIGLLALHWDYYDLIMPADYLTEKEAISAQVVEFLGAFGEVAYEGLIRNECEARRHAELFRQRSVDCIVIFLHMASPGSYGWESLRQLRVPVLIWNAHFEPRIPSDYDMRDLCRKSSNVGALMISNVLVRNGRSFQIITGLFDDSAARDGVAVFLRAAAVYARLKSARIGVLGGGAMPGYLDVEVDHVRLERDIGPRCVFYPQEAWIEVFNGVPDGAVRELNDELRRDFEVVDLSESELLRSARVALALEKYVGLEHLDAVTINCDTNYFRHDERVGIVACLAASRLTTYGIPVACTGDIPTTVAMLIGKVLGAPILYCECDLIDYERDVMAMANTGECDFGLRDPGCRVRVLRNPHFGPAGGCGLGACHFLRIRPGDATLLGFSPSAFALGGWKLIAAPGRILGTFHDKLIAGNCDFEFERKPVADAFNSWVRAGATHHGALCAGDWRREICITAEMLQIGGEVIS